MHADLNQISYEPFMIDDAIANRAKEILEYMCKRHYPSIACYCIFDQFKVSNTTFRALAILDKAKIIKLVKEKSAYSSYFVLLDSNGNEIRHVMLYNHKNSLVYGNYFYDPKISSTCWDHIENDDPDPLCIKCQQQINNTICYAHNNKLFECEQCKQTTIKIKSMLTKDFTHDDFDTLAIEELNKSEWGI